MSNQFTVSFKRIVAVDSASFAYVEVPLDDNLLLLGTGNWGKTSIINAVRFFLLPELSLTKSSKNFGFKNGNSDSGNEFYTTDEVTGYYFPSSQSRLILEVEHTLIGGTTRRHCQIISKGKDYKLNRMFINCPYDDIEHLFWDKTQGVSGARPDVVYGDNLLGVLKTISKSAVSIRNQEELSLKLYKADILHPDECPFVIYPLNEVKKSNIESLRALIKLLFNQDGTSLRTMTATTIDAHETLVVDINHLIVEHQRLEQKRSELDVLKDKQPEFEELQHNFNVLKAEQTYERAYAQAISNIKAAKIHNDKEHSHLIETMTPLLKDKETSRKIFDSITQDVSFTERDIKQCNDKLASHSKIIDSCNAITQPYVGYSLTEVEEAIKDDLEKQLDKKAQCEDLSTRKLRLQELEKLIGSESVKLEKYILRKKNEESSLKSQLTPSEYKLLRAINPSISEANPGRKLLDNEKHAISVFLELFALGKNGVTFFDETLPLPAESFVKNIDNDISDIQSELNKSKQEHKELVNLDNKNTLHNASEIQGIDKKIRLAEKDLELLSKFNFSTETHTVLTNELIQHQANLLEHGVKKSAAQSKLEHATTLFDVSNTKLLASEKVCQSLSSLFDNALHICQRHLRVKALIDSMTPSKVEGEFIVPTQVELDEHLERLEKSKEARGTVCNKLEQFCITGIVEDEHGIMEGNRSQNAIAKTFDNVALKFRTLTDTQTQLHQDTKIHNDYLRNRLDRLDKTKKKIEDTVLNINRELEAATINDLEGIRLSVVINGAFDDLVLGWREFDELNANAILPSSWYARLEEFLQSDAVDSNDGKLRMDNIIKHASYNIKKFGEPWDRKSQSTSTQMLINLHFCEVFIMRLCDDNSAISFPLIMDEVGQVSCEQFTPLINTLKEKGHTLLGATTHGKSADLIETFGNYLIMDGMSTGDPYHASRAKTCFNAKPEYIKRRNEQLTLEAE
nr:hypothetical protein [Pseudoalteromonas sp. TB13]